MLRSIFLTLNKLLSLIVVNCSEFSSYFAYTGISNMAMYVERLESYTSILHTKKMLTVMYQASV